MASLVTTIFGAGRRLQLASVTMSAILSADDLNDFISPGVACIKPVESLPSKAAQVSEVRTASVLRQCVRFGLELT